MINYCDCITHLGDLNIYLALLNISSKFILHFEYYLGHKKEYVCLPEPDRLIKKRPTQNLFWFKNRGFFLRIFFVSVSVLILLHSLTLSVQRFITRQFVLCKASN